MKKEEVIIVRAKCFHDGIIRIGILLPVHPNGMCSMKYLYFNRIYNRLDWIVDEIYQKSIIILRKRSNNQYQLF